MTTGRRRRDVFCETTMPTSLVLNSTIVPVGYTPTAWMNCSINWPWNNLSRPS